MDNNRALEIAGMTINWVEQFPQKFGGKAIYRLLDGYHAEDVHPSVMDFGSYVVWQIHQEDWKNTTPNHP